MKRYFLGAAARYSTREVWRHTFTVGLKKDCDRLQKYLSERYGGEAFLCKNGRSALTLALKSYFEPGEAVIVNGFTCYAVYEAVKAAGLVPVFADISKDDLNFTSKTLSLALERHGVDKSKISGLIVQNTLGNPVDIDVVEKFAKKHKLTIIEDLAHCAGVNYTDGRECGTVGAATILSFGKDKSIDTVSGGAVVLRDACIRKIKAPNKTPKASDHLRARFYPLIGSFYRKLSYIRLNSAFMWCMLKFHWVEKSADNKLDTARKISKFEAKLALRQLQELKKGGESPLREFYYVRNRSEMLKWLMELGFYFGGFWYEKPVSPERYYHKVHFPEDECPNAVWVAEHIVNLPIYYDKRKLLRVKKIIEEYSEEVQK